MNINYGFILKDVILYYENKSNKDLECIVNLFILLAKNKKTKTKSLWNVINITMHSSIPLVFCNILISSNWMLINIS